MVIHGLKKLYLQEDALASLIEKSLQTWCSEQGYISAKCSLIDSNSPDSLYLCSIYPLKIEDYHMPERRVNKIAQSILPRIRKSLEPVLGGGEYSCELLVTYEPKPGKIGRTIKGKSFQTKAKPKKPRVTQRKIDVENFFIIFFSLLGTTLVQRNKKESFSFIKSSEVLSLMKILNQDCEITQLNLKSIPTKFSYRFNDRVVYHLKGLRSNELWDFSRFGLRPVRLGILKFVNTSLENKKKYRTKENEGKSNRQRQK